MGGAPGLTAFVNTNDTGDVDAGTGGRTMFQWPSGPASTVCGGKPGIDDVETALPFGAYPAIVEPRPPRCRTTPSWKWEKKRKVGGVAFSDSVKARALTVSRIVRVARTMYFIFVLFIRVCPCDARSLFPLLRLFYIDSFILVSTRSL